MNEYIQIINILNNIIARGAIFEIEPKQEKLTYEILNELDAKNILYAEYAFPGAMGCPGVSIHYLKDYEFTYYYLEFHYDNDENDEIINVAINFINECSIYPEKIFKETIKLILEKYPLNYSEKDLLKHYSGGAGNNAFINKNIKLKIGRERFIYSKGNTNYIIDTSSLGVFLNVRYHLQLEAGVVFNYPIPRIGIFWLHYKNKEIRIFYKDDIEREKGQKYGDFLTYPNGHYEIWEELKEYDLVPKSSNYEDLPRGRIAYDQIKEEYVIYCGNWIDSAPGIKSLIISEFKFRNNFRWEKDHHYKLFKRWGY